MSMSAIFKQVAGLESEGEITDIVEVTAEEAAEAVVNEEIAVVEKDVEQNQAAVADAEIRIDAVEEKIEELEEEVSGMESMLDGTTPFNAGLFQYRFERATKIAGRFGANVEHMGAESFADASTAQLNAVAGLESAKDTIIKAGGAVKAFFIELYKNFVAVITGLFDRLSGLQKKADLVKASVNKKEKFEGKVKVPALLGKDGTADAVVGAVVAASGAASQNLTSLGGAATDGAVASGVSSIVDALAKAGTKTIKSSTDNTETVDIKINNATVTITSPKKDEGVSDTSIKVTLSKDPVEVDALGKSALVAICSSVSAAAVKLRPAKLDGKALNANRDQAIAKLEKLAAEEGADKGDKKKLIGYVRAGHRAALKLTSGGLKLGGDVLAAQLAFVKAHL